MLTSWRYPHSPAARLAAVRRAAIDRYLLPPGPQQAHAGTDRQTEGWTLYRFTDFASHTMWAVPVICLAK